jgi:hypothetical protein
LCLAEAGRCFFATTAAPKIFAHGEKRRTECTDQFLCTTAKKSYQLHQNFLRIMSAVKKRRKPKRKPKRKHRRKHPNTTHPVASIKKANRMSTQKKKQPS